MFKNFRAFIRCNTPIIIRRKTLENMFIRLINAMDRNNFSVINPVIRDLECLRKNTWDQDKITHIQNWLRNNFKYARKYSNDN
jgi:hypothetical protein